MANITRTTSDTHRPKKPLPIGKTVVYGVLILGTVLALLPFLWMVSWSLMTNVEVNVGRLIPSQVMIENYGIVWQEAEFAKFMWNSARLTAITIFGLLLFCIPAAYAFARMTFYGKNVLFAIMLSTLMIPDIVTLIPNFLTVVWISRLSDTAFGIPWVNNWPGLTVPFMASAFTIFLLRQFFNQIPDDLWDAARMDGASHVQFLLRVVIPLSRAPIMAVVTFAFIGAWNSLLWPLIITPTDETWMPIALALANYVQSEAGNELHLQMAGSVIMVIPILTLYFFTQKQFTEGVYSGSFK